MASVKQSIAKIKQENLGVSGKRVLLVEGADDITAFQNFLTRQHPLWEQHWALVAMGSKKHVLETLSLEPGWLGIVDRDAWTDDIIADKQRRLPNLLVLPRYCIESYLLVPEEIWQALRDKHRQAMAGGLPAMVDHIHSALPAWRNHAAVWSIIYPLWDKLRAAGFNDAFHHITAAQNEAEIEKLLHQWNQQLDPGELMQHIRRRKAEIAHLTPAEQLVKCVHGKMYFEQVIDPLLTQHLGQRSREQRQKDLFKTLPVPADLAFIWNRMGF